MNKEDKRRIKEIISQNEKDLNILSNEMLYLLNKVAPNRSLGDCNKLNQIWHDYDIKKNVNFRNLIINYPKENIQTGDKK